MPHRKLPAQARDDDFIEKAIASLLAGMERLNGSEATISAMLDTAVKRIGDEATERDQARAKALDERLTKREVALDYNLQKREGILDSNIEALKARTSATETAVARLEAGVREFRAYVGAELERIERDLHGRLR
jgi:hypothetical protein